MKYFLLTLLLLSSALFISATASAQTFQSLNGQTISNNINVTTNPAQPGPNQFVTVSIESYATDLDRADISWFINNTLQKEAVGQKTFLFKTGKAGSVSNILILIKTAEGATLQQVINIRPTVLKLVWEAQSYTPPFYRGKALYPYLGTVKIVAVPSITTETGSTIAASSLVYTWSVDGDPVANLSGYGKNFIYFNGSIPISPATVSVVATSLDKLYTASDSITLTPQSPQVVFYEDNPIYGVLYNKALSGNVTLQNEEIKLAGIPYFIGAGQREGGGLTYEWQLNNQNAGASSGQSSLSFKQGGGLSGTALVSLQVSNPAKIFQFAGSSLSLIFGKTPAIQF